MTLFPAAAAVVSLLLLIQVTSATIELDGDGLEDLFQSGKRFALKVECAGRGDHSHFTQRRPNPPFGLQSITMTIALTKTHSRSHIISCRQECHGQILSTLVWSLPSNETSMG